jgi:hypothetical protein
MDKKQIIKEIESLPEKDRLEIYKYLGTNLKQTEHLKSVLEKLKGRGKNILGLEPQDYINKLRSDDRI